MNIITVIPLQKSVFKEELTYFSVKDIPISSIVSIMIRNKKVLGLVVDISPLSTMKSNIKEMDFNLKKITEVKEHSIFSDEFLSASFLTSRYYATNKSTGVSVLIPSIFKDEYDKFAKFKKINTNTDLANTDNKKIKTEKLLFQANFDDRMGIYKTMIRGIFADNKSIYLVLPNEQDIDKYYSLLSKGIENFTFKLHSGVKKKKMLEDYEKIVSNDHPVLILGTPKYLCIKRDDIHTIILEKEHSSAYRMMMKPHFDLRTFVEIYANSIGARLIFADTLLRFETISRKEEEGLAELYPMSFRTNFEGTTSIIGPEKEAKKGEKFKIFKKESLEEIENNINKKKNTFVFALRRGLATQTICKDCNDILICDKCHAPVVLYNSKNNTKRTFVCNRCKSELDANTPCRLCGSWNLLPLGIGTDTVYEELSAIYKKDNIKIFKLDKENAKTAKEAQKIIEEFENEKGAILIGTEIALVYLKDKVPVSIISSFDSLWSIPNYKMGERILEIVLSIIEKTDDKLIIQTKNNKDSALLSIESNNMLPFVKEELSDRKLLDYPPYKRFIKVSSLGDKKEIQEIKKSLQEIFTEYNPELFTGFIAKIKDKYNINMLITLDIEKWSLKEVSNKGSVDEKLFNLLSNLPPAFQIYVDPENIL